MNSANDSVVIERQFDAPIEQIWQLWTDAALFASWYGPRGAQVTVTQMDVVVGGRRIFCMEMMTPNGAMQMWFGGEYLEVDPPQRLAYTEFMATEQGAPKPASELPPGHPPSTQVVVELATQPNGTQVTMTHIGVPADSPGAMGWNMAFDKLAEQLAASD